MNYIQHHHVNRLDLVRDLAFHAASVAKMREQLHGAAQGLEYLHGCGFAHGDLKGVGVSLFCDRSLLTFNRITSSYLTTRLSVLVLRTSVLLPRSPTMARSRAVW